ncbi:MAG: hypothetical protein EOM25_13355 [Deltaproteobacteria bacterium]|nr:hypothetical protein [Deltaproteobacteria bacterium]
MIQILMIPFIALTLLTCPRLVLADPLDDEIEGIVKDFQIHMNRLDPGKTYHVVVRFFIDSTTKKTNRLTEEIERTLIETVIDRLGDRQNIVVLERNRLKDLDREMTFDTDGEMTWDKKMFQKIGAGFLITGSVTGYSDHVRIRAKMIDILTGAIVTGARAKVRLDELDPVLAADYKSEEDKKKVSAPSVKPKEETQAEPNWPPSYDDSSGNQNNLFSDEYEPYQQQQPQTMGWHCCDYYYNMPQCTMNAPGPLGSPCFCLGIPGQGYVCP